MTKKYYYNAISEETAFTVDNYPWGFRLKTEAKFWIERRASHGERFVKMTKNPKTGKWCKPKKSTYSEMALLSHDDEKNKTSWKGVNFWTKSDRLKAFKERHIEGLDEWRTKRLDYLIKLNLSRLKAKDS